MLEKLFILYLGVHPSAKRKQKFGFFNPIMEPSMSINKPRVSHAEVTTLSPLYIIKINGKTNDNVPKDVNDEYNLNMLWQS